MRHAPSQLHRLAVQILCSVALLGSSAGAAAVQTFPDPPDGSYEFTSAKSGLWHDPATWSSGSWSSLTGIPATGDDVLIRDGHVVTIQREEPARHRFIRVEGVLDLVIHTDTRLITETLYVFGDGPGGANDGTFSIGGGGKLVYQPGLTAEVVFISSGAFDLAWDPKQASRGLVSDGSVRLYGRPKTHMINAPGDLLAGTSSFMVEPPWDGWEVGDELVIAGTYFQRVENPALTASQDERVTITSHGGDLFEFEPALAFDHRQVGARPFHIVNLSRSIVLRSEETTQVRDRGHVMLRNADVYIEGVAFVDLGRTDKRIPLDDKVIEIIENPGGMPVEYDITTPAPAEIQNRRGRYALHFHLNGIQPQLSEPPSIVARSVVDGTVGWGFVNHSSHVGFQMNVAYDFAGAGFVTELGDELGYFYNNIAIRGTGNGEYRQDRLVFKNPERPQPLSDFAFSGDGFWFQGPAIRVKNNIANGCDGVGLAWFTTGAPDVAEEFTEDGYTHNRYSHFPRSALADVYGAGAADLLPRYWEHSVTDEKLVISDLPILEFENFTAYGNLVGFKLRFNNHDNVDWYRENPFDYHEDIEIVCGGNRRCAERNRQTLDQLTLWNNEQAFRMRYVTNTDWLQVDAINRLAYDSLFPTHGSFGAELRFRIESQTFTDLSIDGYPVAGWIQIDSAAEARDEVSFFPDPPAYTNYANRDTALNGNDPPCGVPTMVQVTAVGSDSASVTWQAGGYNERYLLRYRPQGEQVWDFQQATTESATLTGLTSGTTCRVQIKAGCSLNGEEIRVATFWTARVLFTTN